MDSDCMNGGNACSTGTCDCSAAPGYTGSTCAEGKISSNFLRLMRKFSSGKGVKSFLIFFS